MSLLLILLVLALNLGVAWWNAYVCGKSWVEAKHLGGFLRLVVWSAAIQSAIGFSSVYLFGLFGIGYLFALWPPEVFQYAGSFWYLSVIVPALGTGLIVTIHSWQVAYRERDIMSMGAAGYNALVMAHNVAQSVDGIGTAVSALGEGFGALLDGDGDSPQAKFLLLAFLLALVALLAGALTTATLIKRYAGTVALPQRAVA